LHCLFPGSVHRARIVKSCLRNIIRVDKRVNVRISGRVSKRLLRLRVCLLRIGEVHAKLRNLHALKGDHVRGCCAFAVLFERRVERFLRRYGRVGQFGKLILRRLLSRL